MSNIMSPQDALVATMVLTSAADRNMSDDELKAITAIVGRLAGLFENYDRDRITAMVAQTVVDVLQADEGLETLIGMIEKRSAGSPLRETAYALACDIAAADQEGDPRGNAASWS